MRIITWNINSVRLRIGQAMRLINQKKPDILCLQETKTPDEFFPFDAFRDKGYVHQHIAGMKGYNGVAILSKHPLTDLKIHRRCGKDDCRHISARVNGFDLHNIYIPAGGYEPDPVANSKFQHKLDFVDELAAWFRQEYTMRRPMVALGDLNIAPLENDVWDHAKMINVVSHTPVEIAGFDCLRQSLGWVDAIRHFVPEHKKAYSWWSYRAPDWKAADRGRRLDHIWVTKPLAPRLTRHAILKEARGWEQPSDHVPVILDLES